VHSHGPSFLPLTQKKKNCLVTYEIFAMESVLSSGQLSGPQKDELMEQVKQQIAVANAQELLTV